jgi:malonyl-ACP decarboxylase
MTAAVVLTGLGAICSIGGDVPAFGRALRAGTCGFRQVADEFSDGGVRLLAPVLGFDFDAAMDVLGLPSARRDVTRHAGRREPAAVQATIAACAQAWADAGLEARQVPAERVGVVVGGHNLTQLYTFEQRARHGQDMACVMPRYALQSQDSHLVATVSEAFGIHGEGYTVGASSASGNAAVIMAARMVACGAVDVCLAVGAMAQLEPAMYAALDKLGVLAAPPAATEAAVRATEAAVRATEAAVRATEAAVQATVPAPRPLDRDRAGLVPGEAAACVVLESWPSARRRGAAPVAELSGVAQVLDGNSLPNPNVLGESRAMAKALADARVTADRVGYVNAHATATPAGDDAEAEAIATAFGSARPWVNATKGLIGHCLGTAGVIETVATAIQIAGGFLHPNPNLRTPIGPGLRYVGTRAVDVEIGYALSNSFGFGGFNSSIVLRRP